MKNTTKWQLIKKYRSYSTKELADLFGYKPSAIKYWVKIGLKPINPGTRRFLFNAEDVIEFIKDKKMKYKVKLQQYECYCASCKKGRRIKPGTLAVEYSDIKLGKGDVQQVIIRGICNKCGHKVVRLSSTARVDEFLKHYSDYKKENDIESNS